MNDLHALVLTTWEDAIGEPAAHDAVDFFDAGGNSLSFLQLTMTLEEYTGTRLPVADVLADPTPSGITALLHRESSEAGSASAEPSGNLP
jgi:hypothetical protein